VGALGTVRAQEAQNRVWLAEQVQGIRRSRQDGADNV
jgi:hypothetical protein